MRNLLVLLIHLYIWIVERAPTWTEGGHSPKNLLKSRSYTGV